MTRAQGKAAKAHAKAVLEEGQVDPTEQPTTTDEPRCSTCGALTYVDDAGEERCSDVTCEGDEAHA